MMLSKAGFWLKPLIVPLVSIYLNACTHIDSLDNAGKINESLLDNVKWKTGLSDAQHIDTLVDLIAIPELTALVEQSLQDNPALKKNALDVQMAILQKRVVTGNRLPEVALNINALRSENTETAYQGELGISWELDLWQKIADASRSQTAAIVYQQWTYQAARDSLTASVMRTWLQLVLQRQYIDIEAQRLKVLESNEDIILTRYRAGLGDLEDLDNARIDTDLSRSQLAQYKQSLTETEYDILQLLGNIDTSVSITTPHAFPVVITPLALNPLQDLQRRPDLQAAYYDIISKQYNARVAYKNLLPSINLSASLSDGGVNISDAFFKSPTWALLGGITAPLFQGGKLRAQADIAELDTQRTYLTYQERLLTAIYEVENSLSREQSLNLQQKHTQKAMNKTAVNVENYQRKYRQGLVDVLDLLSVQQQAFNIQIQQADIKYQQLMNRINLGLALGLGVSE